MEINFILIGVLFVEATTQFKEKMQPLTIKLLCGSLWHMPLFKKKKKRKELERFLKEGGARLGLDRHLACSEHILSMSEQRGQPHGDLAVLWASMTQIRELALNMKVFNFGFDQEFL